MGHHGDRWGPAQTESSRLLSRPGKPEPPVGQGTPIGQSFLVQISLAQRGLED
jgi:hypothetical protein